MKFAAALLALVATTASAQGRPTDRPDTLAIRRLATDLAADSMRGRGPYTPENRAAARRLAAELTKLGGRPLTGNSILVPFTTRERPADTLYNVIAVLPARSGTVTGRLVGVTSHFDHLGVGAPDATGDSIYNGFLDAALPNAMVVDVARRYIATPGDLSLVVMFFNLEEQGFIGSLSWATAERPLLARFTFVLGVDAGSPAGEATNWELMGAEPAHAYSRLADSLARLRGWTTRATRVRPISDAFILALGMIPIVFPIPGAEWKGYTADQRKAAMEKFDHYHQPADGPRPDFPMTGTAAYAEWLWEIVRGASTPPRRQ